MQVSIESLSTLKRKMTVTVPSEEVMQKVEKRLIEVAKQASIKGFRRGKVPKQIVMKRFGAGIHAEVTQDLIKDTYFNALKEQDVQPAGMPQIDPKASQQGEDFTYEAIFEVFPEIALMDLTTISLDKPVTSIGEVDVDQAVEKLREQQATFIPVEDVIAEGDQLVIDYAGVCDTEAVESETKTQFALTIGQGLMPEGFEAALVGQSIKAPIEVSITLPKDYANESLQGKTIDYTVTIHTAQRKQLSELDEAFFEKLGVKGGIDELKADLEKNLQRELKYGLKKVIRQRVVEKLLEGHNFDIPSALIEEEAKRLREQSMNYFKSFQQKGAKIDLPEIPLDLFKQDAEKQVKIGLLFAEMIKQYKLEANEQLVDERIDDLADMYDDQEELRQYVRSNPSQLEQIKAQVLEDQVIDTILATASLQDQAMSYTELTELAQNPS